MPQNLRIASPCLADWDRMAGDDRVRYCPECKLSVYNFSAMTEAEVKRIVAQREGRLCARFYQRPDGTLLTRNCPVGLRRAILRVSRVATAALTAVMSVSPVLARPNPDTLTPPLLLQIKAARVVFSMDVTDQAGAVIAEAQVSLMNEATQRKTEVKTDVNGQLRLVDLSPGQYQVTVESPAFRVFQLAHVAVPNREAMKVTLLISTLMGDVVIIQQPSLLHRFASEIRRIF